MSCDEPDDVTLPAPDRGMIRAAEPGGTGGHDVHHGLEVGRGARDDPQDLGGGGLLLESFRQLAIPCLELREEPDVLDGDDGLSSEGFRQLDLLVREGLHLTPSQGYNADGYVFS